MPHTPVRPQGVNIALFRREHDHLQVLMIQRADTETYPLAWGLITGTRQGDETLIATAFRELCEELALAPTSLWSTNHLIAFYEPENDCIWHAPVFVVLTAGKPLTPSAEIAGIEWLDCDEAVKKARWKSLKRILPELFEEMTCFPNETWQRHDTQEQP